MLTAGTKEEKGIITIPKKSYAAVCTAIYCKVTGVSLDKVSWMEDDDIDRTPKMCGKLPSKFCELCSHMVIYHGFFDPIISGSDTPKEVISKIIDYMEDFLEKQSVVA